jgi:hypothetical protein
MHEFTSAKVSIEQQIELLDDYGSKLELSWVIETGQISNNPI